MKWFFQSLSPDCNQAWSFVQAAAVDASHRDLALSWSLGSRNPGRQQSVGGRAVVQSRVSSSDGSRRWERKLHGWVKASVDGAVKASRVGGGGGVVGDS